MKGTAVGAPVEKGKTLLEEKTQDLAERRDSLESIINKLRVGLDVIYGSEPQKEPAGAESEKPSSVVSSMENLYRDFGDINLVLAEQINRLE